MAAFGFLLFLNRPLLSIGYLPLSPDRPKMDAGPLVYFLTKLGWRSYSELLELFTDFFLFEEEDDEDEELEEDLFFLLKSLLEREETPGTRFADEA